MTAEPEAPAIPQRFGPRQTFAALRHRNYRLWFAGQLTSLLGTWMQSTAQGFLVYELTHSPAYLGYVGFATGLPSWLFMLWGGVVADRIPRRRLLLATQVAMMALAIVLATLTYLHWVAPWHIVLLAFLLGIANAFDAPARQAFVLEMVDREDLTNAIALNSTMFNTATAMGPAVAGLVYAVRGPGFCFAVNAASFLAVIGALLMMRMPDARPRVETSALQALREGLAYVLGSAPIRTLMTTMVITSLFGLSYATLVPAWAVKVLGGDASTNGFLQAARGFGALSAALMIASLGNVRRKGRLLTIGTILYPSLLIVFSGVRATWLALAILFAVGWGQMAMFNMANALVQGLVPDALRGRVMGIYTFTFFGFMPLGAILAGQVAERWGEVVTVAAGSSLALLYALYACIFVPRVRRL